MHAVWIARLAARSPSSLEELESLMPLAALTLSVMLLPCSRPRRYVFSDIAVVPTVNNPAAVWHAQSSLYLLYYTDMGSPMSPPVPSYAEQCTGQPRNVTFTADVEMTRGEAAADDACTESGNCERIAIQYAPSPTGPWRKLFPNISGIDPPGSGLRRSFVTNAAPLVLANGSVMMVFRYNPPSQDPAAEILAVALAQTWDGRYELIADNLTNFPVLEGRFVRSADAARPQVWFLHLDAIASITGWKWAVNCSAPCNGPYEWDGEAACRLASVVSDDVLDRFVTQAAPFSCAQVAAGDRKAEDPCIFLNELGYHIVFHQYNQTDLVTGGHLFSPDGRSWKPSTEAVYDVAMSYANGTSEMVDHRERPTLVTAADGTPQWLITGVEMGSKYGNFPSCYSETAITQILP